MEVVTINQAIRSRVAELLKKFDMTEYRLGKNGGLSHGQIYYIMRDKNNGVQFKTVMQLAKGFNMTLLEFLDSPYFTDERIDLD